MSGNPAPTLRRAAQRSAAEPDAPRRRVAAAFVAGLRAEHDAAAVPLLTAPLEAALTALLRDDPNASSAAAVIRGSDYQTWLLLRAFERAWDAAEPALRPELVAFAEDLLRPGHPRTVAPWEPTTLHPPGGEEHLQWKRTVKAFVDFFHGFELTLRVPDRDAVPELDQVAPTCRVRRNAALVLDQVAVKLLNMYDAGAAAPPPIFTDAEVDALLYAATKLESELRALARWSANFSDAGGSLLNPWIPTEDDIAPDGQPGYEPFPRAPRFEPAMFEVFTQRVVGIRRPWPAPKDLAAAADPRGGEAVERPPGERKAVWRETAAAYLLKLHTVSDAAAIRSYLGGDAGVDRLTAALVRNMNADAPIAFRCSETEFKALQTLKDAVCRSFPRLYGDAFVGTVAVRDDAPPPSPPQPDPSLSAALAACQNRHDALHMLRGWRPVPLTADERRRLIVRDRMQWWYPHLPIDRL